MSDHYKFFQNKKCEYFPCHATKDKENFNCLFCFCPLYLLKDQCGGNFEYNHKQVKNCTKCLIPHSANGYDHIMSKIQQVIEICKKGNE